MTTAAGTKVVRFTATRRQGCLSPWDCGGFVEVGHRGGYVPTGEQTSPAVYCQPCANREQGIDDSTGVCPCTRADRSGFTNVGSAAAPRWVHSACGLPAVEDPTRDSTSFVVDNAHNWPQQVVDDLNTPAPDQPVPQEGPMPDDQPAEPAPAEGSAGDGKPARPPRRPARRRKADSAAGSDSAGGDHGRDQGGTGEAAPGRDADHADLAVAGEPAAAGSSDELAVRREGLQGEPSGDLRGVREAVDVVAPLGDEELTITVAEFMAQREPAAEDGSGVAWDGKPAASIAAVQVVAGMSAPVVPISPAEFMQGAKAARYSGNSDWAARYAEEIRRVVHNHASRAPRSLQRHLGPSEIGHVCLSGDTEVVTRQGIRPIRELAREGSAELLVPLLYTGSDVRKRWGKFLRVSVESFGEQRLYAVSLRRNQDTKTVLATAEHGWFRSYWSGKNKKQQKLTTAELRPGHRLTQLRRARPLTTTLMPFAVAQGFVFGDGTKGSDDDRHRPATLNLFHNGKDEALLKYFPGEHAVYSDPARAIPFSLVKGLPRFWKALPPLDESTSFLMSWLAGYFAADGSVTEDGHCNIHSANEAHLKFVQSAAAICGVGYGLIHKHMRRGISGNRLADAETPMYRLSLRRRDLPEWFFLTARHSERAQAASAAQERDPHWIVESVRDTGRTEEVFCAITGDAGAFALADDLMTGNCDRQVVGKLAGLPVTNHVVDPWPSVVGTAVHTWLEGAFTAQNERIGRARWIPEQRVTPFDGHSGTADLYDFDEQSVDDHKILGESSMGKVRSADGPPVHYVVQLLLYALGYRRAGWPVKRVALLAYPRTAGSLDGLYVWEHELTKADDTLLAQVFARLTWRKELAAGVEAGHWRLNDVPADSTDECHFCPFYRPQAARDGGPGCPGHAAAPGQL